MSHFRLTPERVILLALLAISLLALAFMGVLVEAPKVLMGRSLTAIEPSLFPKLMITALATVTALVLLLSFVRRDTAADTAADTAEDQVATDWKGVWRAVLLFAYMLFFALAMEPFGFLISAFITMVLISLLTGNRSVLQIGLLATVSPILLYLTATRVLAVSLPELNVIELFYARIFGL